VFVAHAAPRAQARGSQGKALRIPRHARQRRGSITVKRAGQEFTTSARAKERRHLGVTEKGGTRSSSTRSSRRLWACPMRRRAQDQQPENYSKIQGRIRPIKPRPGRPARSDDPDQVDAQGQLRQCSRAILGKQEYGAKPTTYVRRAGDPQSWLPRGRCRWTATRPLARAGNREHRQGADQSVTVTQPPPRPHSRPPAPNRPPGARAHRDRETRRRSREARGHGLQGRDMPPPRAEYAASPTSSPAACTTSTSRMSRPPTRWTSHRSREHHRVPRLRRLVVTVRMGEKDASPGPSSRPHTKSPRRGPAPDATKPADAKPDGPPSQAADAGR